MDDKILTMSPAEFRAKYWKEHYHHTGSARGYISRKCDGIIKPYSGRFGTGYVILMPRFDTTQYYSIQYYIFPK